MRGDGLALRQAISTQASRLVEVSNLAPPSRRLVLVFCVCLLLEFREKSEAIPSSPQSLEHGCPPLPARRHHVPGHSFRLHGTRSFEARLSRACHRVRPQAPRAPPGAIRLRAAMSALPRPRALESRGQHLQTTGASVALAVCGLAWRVSAGRQSRGLARAVSPRMYGWCARAACRGD